MTTTLKKITLQKSTTLNRIFAIHDIIMARNDIQSISKQNEGGRRRNETPHPVVKKTPEKKAKGRIRLFFRPPFYPLG